MTELSTQELLSLINSKNPTDQAMAEAEIERILRETPEINAGFELPNEKGVVRYDSQIHDDADVARMTPYLRQRVHQLRRLNPVGRLIITQTADFPGDSQADRRALIAARYGLHLVKE
jgi:hypothetical protein